MISCIIYNKKSFIEKINNHIITMSPISTYGNEILFEFTTDCFSELPIEDNIDITDQITDIFGSSIVGTINDLLKDDTINFEFKDFINKSYELL